MQIFHTNGEDRMALSVFISDNEEDVSSDKSVAKYYDTAIIDTTSTIYSGMGSSFYKMMQEEGQVQKAIELGTNFIGQFYLDSWPRKDESQSGSEKCIDIGEPSLNIQNIFNTTETFSNSFWTYLGSDTVPPCNEDVMWVIMKDPILMSP